MGCVPKKRCTTTLQAGGNQPGASTWQGGFERAAGNRAVSAVSSL